jgi:hypothetical protein
VKFFPSGEMDFIFLLDESQQRLDVPDMASAQLRGLQSVEFKNQGERAPASKAITPKCKRLACGYL